MFDLPSNYLDIIASSTKWAAGEFSDFWAFILAAMGLFFGVMFIRYMRNK